MARAGHAPRSICERRAAITRATRVRPLGVATGGASVRRTRHTEKEHGREVRDVERIDDVTARRYALDEPPNLSDASRCGEIVGAALPSAVHEAAVPARTPICRLVHAPSVGCGGSVPVWRNASPKAW